MNKNYNNGKNRELRIANSLKKQGFICSRTAGSHGIFDVIAIHPIKRKIYLIQAKPKSMSENAKQKLNQEHSYLNDEFICNFMTISTIKEIKIK
ncbi:MAG TPA: hypothetical protein VMZ91_16665 [Candidatus Paceibacterota bacterium]|nr:hypothetical protein [Candidatus Paceibacterota bacterium]